ncbi:Cytochrome bd-I ubiquinol oxidase subunit 2 [secondary endosymbiont of Trabutina mannipara]|uniref:Cytochrome bd-I ubiquinol oxidase subunit 2 n=1 Tax=secondary endosymbiont of Trabutina mannipara TaxID=1835721 RepID=A0A1C3L3S1_9ENTR|nr:cytochrome d ubiquinol oxidase subunit II [secondary endosymbiont of Trabutina mannipara]SBT81921.1 Cytochrome bd-I ubiquinol oxidase subunit 2 [secondary endosymbiont of Trabutina mannipara]
MFNYEFLRFIWWVLIGLFIIIFTITEGFDMGVGILMRFSCYSDIERKIMINTIAPHWDGNQVWLITTIGALFAVWPIVYAIIFSGFYIAIILLLVSLFFRPISFEFLSKIDNLRWRNLCYWGIFIGSFISPIVMGIIFGNLLQGIPFYIDMYMRLYYTGNFFQLLNPFSLLLSTIIIAMFLTQGSTYIQMRTSSNSNLQVKMRNITKLTALITIIMFFLAIILFIKSIDGFTITSIIDQSAQSNPLHKEVKYHAGAWMVNYWNYPILLIFPLLGLLLPFFTIIYSYIKISVFAFISSSFTIACIISTIGITIFPFIIPSITMPNVSLTMWDATSSLNTLKLMFIIVIILLPIVLSYTIWCYYKMFNF